MSDVRAWSMALAASLILSVSPVLTNDTEATHLIGVPDCINTVPAAEPARHDAGRMRFDGYVSGTILNVDVRLIDDVSPAPAPDVFDPEDPSLSFDDQVAGAVILLEAPGLQNDFLLGGAPVTEVNERLLPVELGPATTHAGAQTLAVVFNGHLKVHPPESFSCESVEYPNLIWTFTMSRMQLDGYGTAITDLDDAALEPWGLGVNIEIGPGDTTNA